MRFLIVGLFAAAGAGAAPAYADDWQNFLQISCAPEIGHFSVRMIGTWNFDAPAPPGFVALDQGAEQKADGTWDVAAGSNLFGRCEFVRYEGSRPVPLVFEVIRTKSYGRGDCDGCGSWSGEFEVRLDGKAIAAGSMGRMNVQQMESVLFHGSEVVMCKTVAPFYRPLSEKERFSIPCTATKLEDLLKR